MLMGSTSAELFDPRTITRSLYRPPVILPIFGFHGSAAADDPALNGQKSSSTQRNHPRTGECSRSSSRPWLTPRRDRIAYAEGSMPAGSTNRRYGHYTNQSGRYTFKARRRTATGLERSGDRNQSDHPPRWQTGWAILLIC